MNEINKLIDNMLGDKITEPLSINISGDGNIFGGTVIRVEKVFSHIKSTAWRTDHITAIRDQCRDFGLQDKKKAHLQQTYGVDSLTMLSDADIEEVYQWIKQQR